ncbi:uncharacterized protein LOC126985784 [Eriocheir sinensis]|uniref:uncharacterized protein LOC126985784 n=1 Tax=Eriocheir sinensis TaxID=95602 RepID=UPI0021C701B2|nr:uncharacterized protein LOC126985784 [Eriocheir sinensis]
MAVVAGRRGKHTPLDLILFLLFLLLLTEVKSEEKERRITINNTWPISPVGNFTTLLSSSDLVLKVFLHSLTPVGEEAEDSKYTVQSTLLIAYCQELEPEWKSTMEFYNKTGAYNDIPFDNLGHSRVFVLLKEVREEEEEKEDSMKKGDEKKEKENGIEKKEEEEEQESAGLVKIEGKENKTGTKEEEENKSNTLIRKEGMENKEKEETMEEKEGEEDERGLLGKKEGIENKEEEETMGKKEGEEDEGGLLRKKEGIEEKKKGEKEEEKEKEIVYKIIGVLEAKDSSYEEICKHYPGCRELSVNLTSTAMTYYTGVRGQEVTEYQVTPGAEVKVTCATEKFEDHLKFAGYNLTLVRVSEGKEQVMTSKVGRNVSHPFTVPMTSQVYRCDVTWRGEPESVMASKNISVRPIDTSKPPELTLITPFPSSLTCPSSSSSSIPSITFKFWAHPSSHLTWTHPNGTVLDEGDCLKLSQRDDRCPWGELTLRVRENFDATDLGNYTLRLSTLRRPQLIVSTPFFADCPPTHTTPSITGGVTEGHVLADSTFNATCSTWGSPRPSLALTTCTRTTCENVEGGTEVPSRRLAHLVKEWQVRVPPSPARLLNVTCAASNQEGQQVSESRQVFISDADSLDEHKLFDTRSYIEGDNATLTCQLSLASDSPANLTWMKGTQNLTHRETGSDTPYLKRVTLPLSPVQLADEGLYTCVTSGQEVTVAAVEVKVTAMAAPQWSANHTLNVTFDLRERETLTLECGAEGVPEPRYTWTKMEDGELKEEEEDPDEGEEEGEGRGKEEVKENKGKGEEKEEVIIDAKVERKEERGKTGGGADVDEREERRRRRRDLRRAGEGGIEEERGGGGNTERGTRGKQEERESPRKENKEEKTGMTREEGKGEKENRKRRDAGKGNEEEEIGKTGEEEEGKEKEKETGEEKEGENAGKPTTLTNEEEEGEKEEERTRGGKEDTKTTTPIPTTTTTTTTTSSQDSLPASSSLTLAKGREKDAGLYICVAENRAGRLTAWYRVKYVSPEPLLNPAVHVMKVALVVVGFLLFLLLSWCLRMQWRRHRFTLEVAKEWKAGHVSAINPALSLQDQAHLLPLKPKFEVSRHDITFDKLLGCGAFGRVYRATAKNLDPGDVDAGVTVAVKMIRARNDKNQLLALQSELKILMHIGKHVNIVNLVATCTKNLHKKDLMLVVEYCRFGNILDYMRRHRGDFINQLTENGEEFVSAPSSSSSSYPTYPLSSSSFIDGEKEDGSNKEVYISTDRVLYHTAGTQVTSTQPSVPGGGGGGGGHVTLPSTANTHLGSDMTCVTLISDTHNLEGPSLPVDPEHLSRPLCSRDLLCWAFQVARGMDFLAYRKVLHGDLAARNVLLTDGNLVKISDFGLAKDIYKYNNYKKDKNSPLPVKWMSVEALRDGLFSTQSDVWSYGVVLWEMFSLGQCPFPGVTVDEGFIKSLESGQRMDRPKYCTRALYQVMLDCWATLPGARPSFGSLEARLSRMLSAGDTKYYKDLQTAVEAKEAIEEVEGAGGETANQDSNYLNMGCNLDYANLAPPCNTQHTATHPSDSNTGNTEEEEEEEDSYVSINTVPTPSLPDSPKPPTPTKENKGYVSLSNIESLMVSRARGDNRGNVRPRTSFPVIVTPVEGLEEEGEALL